MSGSRLTGSWQVLAASVDSRGYERKFWRWHAIGTLLSCSSIE